jgi:spore germination protein YaaH
VTTEALVESTGDDITGEIDITQSITGAVERLSRTSQYAVLGGLIALALIVFGVGLALTGGDEAAPPPPPKPDIPLDAWAPYWTLDTSLADAPLRVPSMREISPFWYSVTGVDAITVDENADVEATAAFMDAIKRTDAAIVPSIVDALPAGEMAAIIADPSTRTQHVDALIEFAEAGGYDGLDLDYEQFAFADGRDTWAATRPNWVTFVRQLADRLDDDGRTLTVSIPPVYDAEETADSGFWVYDHGAIAPYVDRIRVMAYDFSVGEPGPIAPLAFVERSINGVLEATGDPEKIVLGLAAYGRNWPVSVSGECPVDVEIPGVTSVNNRTVDELIERREAEPVFSAATGEWSFSYDLEITDGITTCVQTRQVHYVDADGVRLRMDLARQARLDGVALWAFGFDDADVWAEILPTVAD